MEFDKRIKVLCFANEGVVKGLRWAFDQKVYSDRSYDFYGGSLASLPDSLGDFDLFILTLDLGQPVPVENLRKLPGKPGICSFLQPTPQQLLSVNELPDWNSIAWDGVSFEKLALRLDMLATRAETSTRMHHFVEGCQLWLGQHLSTPTLLEWINPPANWAGPVRFALEAGRRTVSVGGEGSRADIELPIEGTRELCEFRFHDGVWSMKGFASSGGTRPNFDPMSALRPGDHVEITEGVTFRIGISRDVEDFMGLARQSGLFTGITPSHTAKSDRTLAEIIREFLASWTTGELRINSGLRNGSIYFKNGNVHHVVAGAVSGAKALLRMLGWADPTWRFTAERRSELHLRELELSFGGFTVMYRDWKDKWNKLQALMPPPHLRLRAIAKVFNQRGAWTPQEYQVLSAICEYSLVRDIFNNCALADADILGTLVEMRRHGLIEPVAALRS